MINGEMHYLWRAADQEGEILESYVTKTRDKPAALAEWWSLMDQDMAYKTIAAQFGDELRSD